MPSSTSPTHQFLASSPRQYAGVEHVPRSERVVANWGGLATPASPASWPRDRAGVRLTHRWPASQTTRRLSLLSPPPIIFSRYTDRVIAAPPRQVLVPPPETRSRGGGGCWRDARPGRASLPTFMGALAAGDSCGPPIREPLRCARAAHASSAVVGGRQLPGSCAAGGGAASKLRCAGGWRATTRERREEAADRPWPTGATARQKSGLAKALTPHRRGGGPRGPLGGSSRDVRRSGQSPVRAIGWRSDEPSAQAGDLDASPPHEGTCLVCSSDFDVVRATRSRRREVG